MLKITAKDKVFIIVAVPVAIIAAYWYFIRKPLTKELSRLKEQDSVLLGAGHYEAEGIMLRKELTASRETLEKKSASAEAKVEKSAKEASSPADRLERVMKIFAAHNITMLGSEPATEAGSAKAMEMVRAAYGIEAPVLRRFSVEGAYQDIVNAMRAFADAASETLIESVAMSSRKNGCSWEIAIWF